MSVIEQYRSSAGGGFKGPGAIRAELELKGIYPSLATGDQKKAAIKADKDKYLAIAMLESSNHSMCLKLNKNLDNDYTKGHNTYPSNLTVAYKLIVK
jgi:hypothetical protein